VGGRKYSLCLFPVFDSSLEDDLENYIVVVCIIEGQQKCAAVYGIESMSVYVCVSPGHGSYSNGIVQWKYTISMVKCGKSMVKCGKLWLSNSKVGQFFFTVHYGILEYNIGIIDTGDFLRIN